MPANTDERQRSTIPIDTFAARLMLVRMHAGYLTINEAAERCGLNYGSWSNWERGKQPRDLLGVVQAISENLGVDRDWLMWGGPLANPRRGLSRATREYRALTVSPAQATTRPTTPRPSGGPNARTPSQSVRRPTFGPRRNRD